MAHNILGTLETPDLAEELVPVPDKQNDAAEIGPAWLHLSRRGLWIALGVSFLLIGAVGVFLPLIPTTGPLIVAAWAFAKGSPALHRWLLSNRLFGPFILEWETYGVIKPRAKLLAVLTMVAAFLLSLVLDVRSEILILQAVVLAAVSAFLLTRPSPPA